MIQLFIEISLLSFALYLIIVKLLKLNIKFRIFIFIGLSLYIVLIVQYIYWGNKVPEGTIPVTPEEISNPKFIQ